MEEARMKASEMERSLQNIVERLSGQAQTTHNTSQQEVGRSGNLNSDAAVAESASAEQGDLQNTPAGSVPVYTFGSNIYQKLPHPFCQQIKELPIVDGSDVDKLLEFLLGMIRMNQVGQWREPMIYEVVYPHCRGEVLDLLIKATAARENFEAFHEKILEQMIPAHQLSQLRTQRYVRVQMHSESLAQYCQSIRDATQVLRINPLPALT
jgi:hypothetical protein